MRIRGFRQIPRGSLGPRGFLRICEWFLRIRGPPRDSPGIPKFPRLPYESSKTRGLLGDSVGLLGGQRIPRGFQGIPW
eukprot:2576718-Pyramimonas_sp.AAC.1